MDDARRAWNWKYYPYYSRSCGIVLSPICYVPSSRYIWSHCQLGKFHFQVNVRVEQRPRLVIHSLPQIDSLWPFLLLPPESECPNALSLKYSSLLFQTSDIRCTRVDKTKKLELLLQAWNIDWIFYRNSFFHHQTVIAFHKTFV